MIDFTQILSYPYSRMRIQEKLQNLLFDAKITYRDLYERQKEFFPKKQWLSISTCRKVIKEDVQPRFSTILKLCQLLDVSLLELIEDTEYGEAFLMRAKDRPDGFTYNDKATAEIITSPAAAFMGMELTLQPGARTVLERSPADKKYEKLVCVLGGRLKLVIDNVEHTLRRKDSMTFLSSKPHYFQNTHSVKCVCHVILSPKHY